MKKIFAICDRDLSQSRQSPEYYYSSEEECKKHLLHLLAEILDDEELDYPYFYMIEINLIDKFIPKD